MKLFTSILKVIAGTYLLILMMLVGLLVLTNMIYFTLT